MNKIASIGHLLFAIVCTSLVQEILSKLMKVTYTDIYIFINRLGISVKCKRLQFATAVNYVSFLEAWGRYRPGRFNNVYIEIFI